MSGRAILQNTPQQQLFLSLNLLQKTLSMIHVKKNMEVFFSKIICGPPTKIHLHIMDLYLSVTESKV